MLRKINTVLFIFIIIIIIIIIIIRIKFVEENIWTDLKRVRNKNNAREKCVLRSFKICALRQMLLWWSSEGEVDVSGIWHVWGGEAKCVLQVLGENLKQREGFKHLVLEGECC
jgi:hypothetical protein